MVVVQHVDGRFWQGDYWKWSSFEKAKRFADIDIAVQTLSAYYYDGMKVTDLRIVHCEV